MVTNVFKVGLNVLLPIVLTLCVAGPAGAHEVAVHEKLTSMAVAYLRNFRLNDIPESCVANLNQHLTTGAREEDEPYPGTLGAIGPFFFHFLGDGQAPLDDVPLLGVRSMATCNPLQWSTAAPGSCAASLTRFGFGLLGSPHVRTNLFSVTRAVQDLRNNLPGTAAHNQGLEGLGHYLHLLQDLTSPAHVRNDAHPHADPLGLGHPSFVLGDESLVEVVNKFRGEPGQPAIPAPAFTRGLEMFQSREQAFSDLRAWTVSRFRSEQDIEDFAGSGPVEDHQDAQGYVYDEDDRRIAKRWFFGGNYIDDVVAREQFDELAVEAILYTARLINYLMAAEGVVLCVPSGDVVLSFEGLGGQVLSRCEDATATLPACGPNGIRNFYPGITFYGEGGSEVAVFELPDPPVGLPATDAGTSAICPIPNGVRNCRANLFVRFSQGVTRFAYAVVGGYTFRGPGFGDDFNGLIFYGPFGLQIDQSFGRMFFDWHVLIDRRQFNLQNVTGFEFFTTNGHVDIWGLNSQGGLAIDEIRFTR